MSEKKLTAIEARLTEACESFNARPYFDAEIGRSRAAELRERAESCALHLLLGAIQYFVDAADIRTVKKADLVDAVERAFTGAVEYEQRSVTRQQEATARIAERKQAGVTP